ncbi:MliC family protein [Otariodibacter sp.]|uniref:MliC family protein n=1 Tax=Otariodibacter sp. TaxID=3030919 RepID=UPI002614C8EE|nr:MliC family protein [Otariodibacter sp.]
MKKLLSVLLLSVASMSANATVMTNSSTDELTKIAYACENKDAMEVVFVNTSKDSYAIIVDTDEMIPMKIQKSASGAIYKAISPDYNLALYTKGKEATLMAGNETLKSCVTE